MYPYAPPFSIRDLALNCFRILNMDLSLFHTRCQPSTTGVALGKPVNLECSQGITKMSEMFTAAFLSFSLILVGIVMGYLLLKIQGDKEETL